MKFRFASGIYFKDTLFNSNLDLKTGFLLNYFGSQKISFSGFEYQTVKSSYRIDFTLAGEIQNRAIVYFTWENLLDEEYYIFPYYPMPERHIRFGVAWEILN